MYDVETSESSDAIELLTFKVGGQDYAIDIGATREIRGWTNPSVLPDAPEHILGVINLRGDVLPLLDLAARLGLETPVVNEKSVIIVAEFDDTPFGLLVDAVSDIITPLEDDMQTPPEAATNGSDRCVRALTILDENLVRVLELSSVIPAKALTF